MSIGFTSADLANLKAALVSGALEVQIGDRRVKYHSLADILAIIQMVQAELEGVSTDVDDNASVVKATFSRGGS